MGYVDQVEELEDFLRFNIPSWASKKDIAEALVREGWLKSVDLTPKALIKDGICMMCNCDVIEYHKVQQRVTVDDLAQIACDIYWGPKSYESMKLRKDKDALEHWEQIGKGIHNAVYKYEVKNEDNKN